MEIIIEETILNTIVNIEENITSSIIQIDEVILNTSINIEENIISPIINIEETILEYTIFVEDLKIPGSKGDSAYVIALNNGFLGTELEWLNSLKATDTNGGIIY
jgi:hypothetical protein